jgi:hypothetical protein
MERVGLLINKLQEQLDGKASPASMQITAQMLLAQLQQLTAQTHTANRKVSVLLPTVLQAANEPIYNEPAVEAAPATPVQEPVALEPPPIAAPKPEPAAPAPQPFVLRPPVQPQIVTAEIPAPEPEPQAAPAFVWEIPAEEALPAPVAEQAPPEPTPVAPTAPVMQQPLVQEPVQQPAPVVAEPEPEPIVAYTPPPVAAPAPEPVAEPAPVLHEPEPLPVQQQQAAPTPIAPWFTESMAAIPTLAQQETKVVYELHETIAADNEDNTINQRLKEHKTEVASVLQGSPVRDLKKAIGINDRYAFINELFRGDENMYERSIKTINAFNIYPEAEYWIQRELKIKIGWNEDSEIVKQFDQLVKRRFS